ncbi:MAG TPA: ABC transporter permease [Solirubrobacteraceae bacterium]|nr:ABC transporter permease [Solirubrobacteraceae bacterium]
MTLKAAATQTPAGTLRATALLYRRLARQQLRSPLSAVNLLIALFFLAVYDGAFGHAGAINALVGGSFLRFILPVTILNASISGTSAGQLLVADLEAGYLRRLLTMPISRTSLVLAPMLVGASSVIAQAAVVELLGIALGAGSATGAAGWLVVLALALLWGLAFAGYSVASGLLAGNAAAAQTATFIFFPLTFLAPTFLPLSDLEGWLRIASYANPTTYVLEGMRSVLIHGWQPGRLAIAFAVVAAMCALTLLWAARTALRQTSRR